MSGGRGPARCQLVNLSAHARWHRANQPQCGFTPTVFARRVHTAAHIVSLSLLDTHCSGRISVVPARREAGDGVRSAAYMATSLVADVVSSIRFNERSSKIPRAVLTPKGRIPPDSGCERAASGFRHGADNIPWIKHVCVACETGNLFFFFLSFFPEDFLA